MRKQIILIFIGHYIPGYKAGGPLRSIANIVEHLHNEFEFWIITSDRDLLDLEPYPDIHQEQWCLVGQAHVYYCPLERCTIRYFARILNEIHYDMMYLNSFFSPVFTLKPLIAIRIGLIKPKPILLAPRGEFSEGALALKRVKKIIYIVLTKMLGLYRNVTWHASSKHEKKDIERFSIARFNNILIASNLSVIQKKRKSYLLLRKQYDEKLRIVFLSRISIKKNLDFALKVLVLVKENVIFDIYGPREDLEYFKLCQVLADNMPENVKVAFYGAVKPENVANLFSTYDLFFFPTLGENYGHVISESLSVGTPVLISDQTPWKNLVSKRLGWDIAFQSGKEKFADIIEQYSRLTREERNEWRNDIQDTIIKRQINSGDIEASRQLFRNLLNSELSGFYPPKGLS